MFVCPSCKESKHYVCYSNFGIGRFCRLSYICLFDKGVEIGVILVCIQVKICLVAFIITEGGIIAEPSSHIVRRFPAIDASFLGFFFRLFEASDNEFFFEFCYHISIC